jgi:hypothetical protein
MPLVMRSLATSVIQVPATGRRGCSSTPLTHIVGLQEPLNLVCRAGFLLRSQLSKTLMLMRFDG